jgi:hypothetical protein
LPFFQKNIVVQWLESALQPKGPKFDPIEINEKEDVIPMQFP